jgi:hypothetical protein
VDDLLLGFGFCVLTLFWALIAAHLSAVFGNPREQDFAQRRKAEQRAYALLKRWLSPEQVAQLECCGYFEVRGSHSGKRYRIRGHRNMNIDELDGEGSRIAVWCFGPAGNLPLGDHMLAQKIALETDEQAALAHLAGWSLGETVTSKVVSPNAGVTLAIVGTGRSRFKPSNRETRGRTDHRMRRRPNVGAPIGGDCNGVRVLWLNWQAAFAVRGKGMIAVLRLLVAWLGDPSNDPATLQISVRRTKR